MQKPKYQPSEEELKLANEFIKLEKVRGMHLNEMLCHFASRNVVESLKHSHQMIQQMEESEAHEGGGIPISDLFEDKVINRLFETL